MSEEREQVSHPAITGNCRWVEANAADILRAGESAGLEVTTGKRKQTYNVERIVQDGRVVAYTMSYFTASRTVKYILSMGTGEGLERALFCSCRDAQYRPRNGGGPGHGCRHCNSLRAGLSTINLL